MSSVQLWSHQRIQQLILQQKQKKDFHGGPVAGVGSSLSAGDPGFPALEN